MRIEEEEADRVEVGGSWSVGGVLRVKGRLRLRDRKGEGELGD